MKAEDVLKAAEDLVESGDREEALEVVQAEFHEGRATPEEKKGEGQVEEGGQVAAALARLKEKKAALAKKGKLGRPEEIMADRMSKGIQDPPNADPERVERDPKGFFEDPNTRVHQVR